MTNDQPLPPHVIDAIRRVRQDTFVRHVDWHAEIDSTNREALRLAVDPASPTSRVIWAETQTAGRGRGANRWWSADGSLTFSLIVEPEEFSLARSTWPQLSLTTGLAVCRALREVAPSATITLKWPNDVFLADRKIGGILIESPSSQANRLVIGIGLNVQNSLRAAPNEVRAVASSLIDDGGANVSPADVLVEILRQWETAARELARDSASVCRAWNDINHLANRVVEVTAGSTVVLGRCLEIDSSGALVLQSERGRESCLAGSVRLVG